MRLDGRSPLEPRLHALITDAAVEAGLRAVHVESGEEVLVAPDRVLPTASTFKTPLAVEVFRQADAGRLDLDARMALENRHKTLASGVLQRLSPGLQPTLRDLVVLSTIISDNTATEMLVERIGGADALNAAFAALGMASSHYAFGAHGMFTRAFGQPEDVALAELQRAASTRPWDFASDAFACDARNTVSTARDLSNLMVALARREAASPASCRELLGIMAYQQRSDRIPRRLPYGSVFNKTGGLGGVRADVRLIRRPGRGHVAYAFLTFDPTPLPAGNSDLLLERTARVDAMFGEVGRLLFDDFATGEVPA